MAKERVLLKISGEALRGQACDDCDFPIKNDEVCNGYNIESINFMAEEINSIKNLFELAIVVGGGNLIRGTKLKESLGLQDSVTPDHAGMLATIINAIIFQDILENKFGLETRVMSAIEVRAVAEPYIKRRAIRHLEKGRLVLLAGGTGNPKFTTDTAMVLRAEEIGAKKVLKGTKVEGIFDKDPKIYSDAKFISKISYLDYLNMKLEILDSTSVTLASDNSLIIKVFNVFKEGNLRRVLVDGDIGSEIS